MADIDILSFPVAPGLGGAEDVPIVQGGVNKRTSVQAIANMAIVPSAVTWKQQCAAATTEALSPNTYDNGLGGVGATLTATDDGALTVDGYLPVLNDRILVKDETESANNGIYFLSQVGDDGTPWILTRAIDFDSIDNIAAGDACQITDGSTLASTFWIEVTVPTSIGSSPIVFAQLFLQYTAGNGIEVNGASIAIDPAVVATLTGAQTLFNKTLSAPVITGLTANAILGTDGAGTIEAASTTGSGSVVLDTSPTLVTPDLGVPSFIDLTNAVNLPPGSLPDGTSGLPIVGNGMSTPATFQQVPISTGVGGLATGISTFLGTASSAALAAAMTDETGSGALVFGTSPTLVSPALGTPTSITLTNGTGLPIASGVSGLGSGVATFLGNPTSANLAAAVTDETGTGSLVFANTPSFFGTPRAPTADPGTNTTQIATTAFVLANAGQSLNFATYALAEAYSPASAPPYIQLAGYFSAGDGGGALYTKVASEPSHAGKLSITLSDGVTVVWYEIAEQVLTERMFGVVCDGNWDGTGTDNAVALQNWASCPVGLKKLFTGCSFSSTGTSFLPGVWLEGGGQTTGIDMTGVASMPGNFAVINCDQSSYLTAISGLSADITNPTQVPLTSAAGISPGDYICIYNPTDFSWSGYRSTYRAGEWFKVGFVSGNTLTPTEVLWHTYAAADVDLYKLTGPQVILRNFRVKPPYIVARGIFVDCSIAPIIENIVGTGSRYCNIELQRCLEEYVNCRLFELEDTVTVGDEYGIIHSACTRGQIFGEYHSQRHGIANGNSDFVCCVPNREIVVYASTFGYDGAPSLDFGHGCNEGLQAVGGSHSGIVLGGSSPKLVNLRLRKGDGQGTGASGVTEIMNGSEFWGGEFQFVGCEFDLYSNPTSAGFGAFAFTLEADLVAPIIFRMNDCKFGNYGGAVYWFQVSVSGNTQLASVIVTNPRIDDPNATLVQFVRLAYGSGPGVFDLVRVTGVNGLGNVPRCATTSASITANKWQFDPQMGTASVAGSTSVAAVTQTVTYPWAYPTGCTPLLTTTHGSRLLGGSQWYPYPNGNTNASASLGAATNSGSNFGSTATGNINWKVETA